MIYLIIARSQSKLIWGHLEAEITTQASAYMHLFISKKLINSTAGFYPNLAEIESPPVEFSSVSILESLAAKF